MTPAKRQGGQHAGRSPSRLTCVHDHGAAGVEAVDDHAGEQAEHLTAGNWQSASRPPQAASATARAPASPVAMFCIQVPLTEITCPLKIRR
jgi:hypothetical protein